MLSVWFIECRLTQCLSHSKSLSLDDDDHENWDLEFEWKIKLGKIALAYQCRWMYTDSSNGVQKEERASEREHSCNVMESLLDY